MGLSVLGVPEKVYGRVLAERLMEERRRRFMRTMEGLGREKAA